MDKKIKILLAPNSFKESASSEQIIKILQSNLSDEKFDIIPFPISDGGDGFLEICKHHFNLEIINFKASSPYDETLIDVPVGYKKDIQTIYIESAEVLGLHLIPKEWRKPIKLNSKGMGDLLNSLQNKTESGEINVKKVIVGVGGSGTNDLGIGMCSRLGLKLFDESKNELEPIPLNFNKVKDIYWAKRKLNFDIEIVMDVDNPLLGKNGATCVFGKQKGSTEKDLELIENGFENLINLFYKNNLSDSSKELSGAAGGLAAAFQIFFNSNIKSSEDFIIKDLQLNKYWDIDIALTGEGAFDNQSFMKKAPGIVINFFKKKSKKIFIIKSLRKQHFFWF